MTPSLAVVETDGAFRFEVVDSHAHHLAAYHTQAEAEAFIRWCLSPTEVIA